MLFVNHVPSRLDRVRVILSVGAAGSQCALFQELHCRVPSPRHELVLCCPFALRMCIHSCLRSAAFSVIRGFIITEIMSTGTVAFFATLGAFTTVAFFSSVFFFPNNPILLAYRHSLTCHFGTPHETQASLVIPRALRLQHTYR